MISVTLAVPSSFKAPNQSSLEAWIFFQTSALAGSGRRTCRQRKLLLAEKNTSGHSSLLSLAKNGSATATSQKIQRFWFVRPELDIPNLEKLGEAYP